jgi:type II secretory pathway pseudopilin PulG
VSHGRRIHRRGITLLELLILLAIAGALMLIALPTLHPSEEEATMDFAKGQLRYLYSMERQYYALHGKYAPFGDIAKDQQMGRTFDRRFASERPVVNGVTFEGPVGGQALIYATLPDGSKYRIDQTGEVTAVQ